MPSMDRESALESRNSQGLQAGWKWAEIPNSQMQSFLLRSVSFLSHLQPPVPSSQGLVWIRESRRPNLWPDPVDSLFFNATISTTDTVLPVNSRIDNPIGKMNWTEGALYRHNRGRLRKANPARQRQKEYFARARARLIESKAAEENGPPPISFLQQSDSPSSQRSRGSHRSGSSAGRRASQTSSRRRTESTRKRPSTMGPTDDMALPTISRFFQERSGGTDAAVTQVKYDEEALERMRQKLLAKKD